MEKVINFEDKNIKYVLLSRGTYLIDGEIVSVDDYKKTRVKVKDSSDIRIVQDNVIIDYYLNQDDNSRMTVSEYNEKLEELVSYRTYEDEYDEYGSWSTLEDEYNYKKFKLIWKQITKTVQSISDPILVEEVKTTYETGNKFIKNAYLNGDSDHDLYIYFRKDAWLNIVRECFNELKMEFFDGCGYDATKNRKIWGNSTHSCIRYVTAFGGYVFDDRYKEPNSIKGTLEDMKAAYEKDRNSIRKIIRTKYNTTFGKSDKKVDLGELLNRLYSLRSNINSIQSKKATWSDQNAANRKINEVINYIEDKLGE